jgi:peptidyl-prolyl cis-trans isomerase SurA
MVSLGTMSLRKVVLVVAVAAVTLAAVVQPARATIVERVVAVVGERAVLWTELLRRAAPPRLQIRQQAQDVNVISVQEQEMYKELLDRMIDDRLEEQQAEKAHISASPEEIDRGIANIASQAQVSQGRPVSVDDVMTEMRRRGFQESDFRDEIRRQIVEGKLIELRVRPRVRVTEQDGQEQYQKTMQQMKDAVDLRTLALRVPAGSTNSQTQAEMDLALRIQQEANSGTDFCQLVKQYSDNAPTRDTCGSQGPKRVTELLQPIQDAIHKLPAGKASEPLPIQMGGEQVILVISWMPPTAPPYETVKNEMLQQALAEGLDRERKRWLQELRHSVYIDVRL